MLTGTLGYVRVAHDWMFSIIWIHVKL